MKYFLCVLDFEATCCDDNSKPKQQMEIIEFFSILYEIDEEKMDVSYWTNPKDVILSNVDCKFKTNK